MKVLVVDDEAPARRRLVRMLERIADVEVVGEADDGSSALRQIAALRPDVVLLDIHMPELDGMELAETTAELPALVFVTAHPDYAVRAFAVAAHDYLLKPVQQARLEQALARVATRARPAGPAAPVRISARAGDSVRLFDPRSITRFRAADKYTVFRVGPEEHVLDDSLNNLEERLAGLDFLRVHRSELVNLREARALHQRDGAAVLELSDGQRAQVSRRAIAELKRRLGLRDGEA
ncbi:LytR/AlgR family response regulator transcription factor [Nannocystis pusilla]|uniref:LytR/AlgR family response regulator transcription factor n=1 Tax=Nannocystis pusilla TaxID=889268 RepID=UPI003BF23AA6